MRGRHFYIDMYECWPPSVIDFHCCAGLASVLIEATKLNSDCSGLNCPQPLDINACLAVACFLVLVSLVVCLQVQHESYLYL